MQQVKDCVAAAHQGLEWRLDQRQQVSPTGGHALDDGSSSSSSRRGGGDSGDSGGGSGGREGRHFGGASSGTLPGGGTNRGSSGEARESRQPGQAAEEAVQLDGFQNRASLGGALLAWIGIVGMFLSLIPIMYRRSRRRKALPDRGPKVSV